MLAVILCLGEERSLQVYPVRSMVNRTEFPCADEQLAAYPLATSLHELFIPILLRLVQNFDSHRLG